jgi:hypothetical protein
MIKCACSSNAKCTKKNYKVKPTGKQLIAGQS